MEHVFQMAFGGGDLDRAAALRGDAAALAALVADNGSAVLLFWRGKPLVIDGGDHVTLGFVRPDHPVAREAGDLFFMGMAKGRAIFAAELTGWEPEDVDFSTLGAFLDPSRQAHPDLPDDHVFAELRAVMTRLDATGAEIAATAKALFGWHTSHRFCSRCGAPSRLAQAGWQRNCDSCGGQHFPRTDPVVIMLVTHGNSVLLGRSPGWPEGMYSLLAGFVEPGETIEAAVRREVHEETGVTVGSVDYLASQPWPFPASLMIGCSGRAEGRDITLDPNELEDALWVTKEELAMVFADEHPVIRPARRGAIAHAILRGWLSGQVI